MPSILLIGATGNLGQRLIVSLLHLPNVSLTVLIRSPSKLSSLIPVTVLDKVSRIAQGDATRPEDVEKALEEGKCSIIVCCASGNRWRPFEDVDGKGTVHGQIARAIVAAVDARGGGVRGWFIGGLGSLAYPGDDAKQKKIQDMMWGILSRHHRETVQTLQGVEPSVMEWTVVCVAMMTAADTKTGMVDWSRGTDVGRRQLEVGVGVPPRWEDAWVKRFPLVGELANVLMVVLGQYGTRLEDVADFLADNVEQGRRDWVGELVGFKDTESK